MNIYQSIDQSINQYLLCDIFTKNIIQLDKVIYFVRLFTVSYGVKQGGIISPILFNVYIDEVSAPINCSNIGGIVGILFLNTYTDDLCLISLSSVGMKKPLNVCLKYTID